MASFNAKKEGNKPMVVSAGGDFFVHCDFDIYVCDFTTNAVVAKLEGHTESVEILHVFEDATTGRLCLASGSSDKTIIVWNLETNERIKVLRGADTVRSICSFVDEGAGAGDGAGSTVLASASYNKTVRLWSVDSSECIAVMEGHDRVLSICTFVDGDGNRMLATGSSDNTVRVWDVKRRKCVRVLEGHTNTVWPVCMIWRGKKQLIASGSFDKTVRLWDAKSGECVSVLEGHTSVVTTLTPFSSRQGNSILASGSDDSSIRVWDVESMACLAVLNGHSMIVRSVSFVEGLSDDSIQLVSSFIDNKNIAVWNVTQVVKHVRYCLSYNYCFLVYARTWL